MSLIGIVIGLCLCVPASWCIFPNLSGDLISATQCKGIHHIETCGFILNWFPSEINCTDYSEVPDKLKIEIFLPYWNNWTNTICSHLCSLEESGIYILIYRCYHSWWITLLPPWWCGHPWEMPRVVTCPTPILVETKGTASTMTSLYPCFQINVSSYTNTDREQEETKNISMFEAYHSFHTLKVSLRWAHQFWYLYPLVNDLTYDLKLPTPLQTCTRTHTHTHLLHEFLLISLLQLQLCLQDAFPHHLCHVLQQLSRKESLLYKRKCH